MFVRDEVDVLPFTLNVLVLSGRHIILLPKLNSAQLAEAVDRFIFLGFRVEAGREVTAKRDGTSIHLSPDGFCWSMADPTDVIVPLIPALLASPREDVPVRILRERYFEARKAGAGVIVKFKPRIESSRLWNELRASGECGITPDEQAIIRLILSSAGGTCNFVTDFPVDGSKVRRMGTKQYYSSRLTCSEASDTLRVLRRKGERNSYLPEDGILRFDRFVSPPPKRQLRSFASLGEWCSFNPFLPERSI